MIFRVLIQTLHYCVFRLLEEISGCGYKNVSRSTVSPTKNCVLIKNLELQICTTEYGLNQTQRHIQTIFNDLMAIITQVCIFQRADSTEAKTVNFFRPKQSNAKEDTHDF